MSYERACTFVLIGQKNGKHYQATQQEEAYYHKIQVSINVVVAYMSSNVTSHCTISDI